MTTYTSVSDMVCNLSGPAFAEEFTKRGIAMQHQVNVMEVVGSLSIYTQVARWEGEDQEHPHKAYSHESGRLEVLEGMEDGEFRVTVDLSLRDNSTRILLTKTEAIILANLLRACVERRPKN